MYTEGRWVSWRVCSVVAVRWVCRTVVGVQVCLCWLCAVLCIRCVDEVNANVCVCLLCCEMLVRYKVSMQCGQNRWVGGGVIIIEHKIKMEVEREKESKRRACKRMEAECTMQGRIKRGINR